MTGPVKCSTVKGNGLPCRSWSVRGSDPALCLMHSKEPVPKLARPKCYCAALSYPHSPGKTCVPLPEDRPTPPPTGAVTLLPAEHAKRSAPVPFDTDRKRLYVDLIASGGRRYQSAKVLKLHHSVLTRHIKSDDAFREAIEEAERQASEAIEVAVWKLASGEATGVPHWEAARWWLANRTPDRWRGDLRAIDVNIAGQIDHVHDTADRLAKVRELEAKLIARAALAQGDDVFAEDAELVEPAELMPAPRPAVAPSKATPGQLGEMLRQQNEKGTQ